MSPINWNSKIIKSPFNIYYFLSKYYKNAEKGVVERETCDMGYKNYKCDTIQDGVVIVKKTGEDRPENPSKDDLDGYYD